MKGRGGNHASEVILVRACIRRAEVKKTTSDITCEDMNVPLVMLCAFTIQCKQRRPVI